MRTSLSLILASALLSLVTETQAVVPRRVISRNTVNYDAARVKRNQYRPERRQVTTTTIPGDKLNDLCTSGSCAFGLYCDFIATVDIPAVFDAPARKAGQGLCKAVFGGLCIASSDCRFGGSCSGGFCASTPSGGNNGCDPKAANPCAEGLYCSTYQGCNENGPGGMNVDTRITVTTTCCKARENVGCNIPTDCGGADRVCKGTEYVYPSPGGRGGVCACANEDETVCPNTGMCAKECTTMGSMHRRARQQQNIFKGCPGNLTACPIPGTAGYECVDTTQELENCGGCSTSSRLRQLATGKNCLSVASIGSSMACVAGKCLSI